MERKTLSLTMLGALVSGALLAQAAVAPTPPRAVGVPGGMAGTRIAGTMRCDKGTRNALEVGDEAGHALAIGKSPCTWTKPMTMGGSTTKEGTSSVLSDARGDVSSDHGYHVGTMANGDKYFVRFDGRTESSKSVVKSQMGRWGFTGGTGSLTGLQGRGTYKSTGAADGSTTVEVEGEYRLPTPVK